MLVRFSLASWAPLSPLATRHPLLCAHHSRSPANCVRTLFRPWLQICAHPSPNPKTNPHPAQRAPANARAGKHKPTNKHDRDEHHNSDSSARHQVGGFCLAEILGFGTRIGNPFFTCNWDFSLEWRGFVVFGCAFWVLGCFWVG